MTKGGYKKIGEILVKNGKVTIDFPSDHDRKFFGKIKFGTGTYSPEDGQEYIDSFLASFAHGSGYLIEKEA